MNAITAPSIDPRTLAGEIKLQARKMGFDLVGITTAEPSRYRNYLQQWLDDGKAGTMTWLANRFNERIDPRAYFPPARSVICVASNYHVPLKPPADRKPLARIARYALGDDYHEVMKDRQHDLADWLRELVPGTQTCSSVDTAPVLERELAARAGIGWVGKNTLVMNSEVGSWILLGEIFTSLELPADEPAIDRCGTCTRCIDACPTGAITAPYQLDARRCISYLNIEHRGEIAADLQQPMGDWIIGCDICQEVCPWNRDALVSTEPAWQPRFAEGGLDAGEILNWQTTDYQAHFRNSAIKRVKLPVLQRNAAIVKANQAQK